VTIGAYPAGVVGPQGAVGATGPTGGTGATGPTGAGPGLNLQSKTANYTAVASDYVICTGTFTVQMPAGGNGQVIAIACATGIITVARNGSELFYKNGDPLLTTLQVLPGQTIYMLGQTGFGWYVIGDAGNMPNKIAKSTTYTAVDGDHVLGTGSFTITLPDPGPTYGAGKCIRVTSVNGTAAAPLTISTPGGAIVGPGIVAAATSIVLGAPGAFVELQSDGTNWNVISGAQDTGWKALTLETGYSDYGGGFLGAAARKVGAFVKLRGLVKYTTISSYATWTPVTLPTGFRPITANLIFSTIGSYVGGTNLAFRTDVNTAGTVVGNASSGVNWTGDYFSLSGIEFSVDQ
jgi:hypothetical protein